MTQVKGVLCPSSSISCNGHRPFLYLANCLQIANGVHRRPSASTIISKTCMLDGDQSRRRSNSLPPPPFQLALNGDGIDWSLGGAVGDVVFAPVGPLGDVPPFPMPTYEVQNMLSAVTLRGSDTGTKDMKSATMQSRLTVIHNCLCLEANMHMCVCS